MYTKMQNQNENTTSQISPSGFLPQVMQYQNENTTSQVSPSGFLPQVMTTSQVSPSVTKCGFPQVDKIKSANAFPNVAIVKENYEKNNRERITPFAELTTNVVYHMYNVQSLRTKDGRTSYYAEFMTEDDKYYKAWIPESLLKKFEKLQVEDCWMVSEGKKTFSNNINKTYWATMVMKKE